MKEALVQSLRDIGHFLMLSGKGRFRAQAYLRAARHLEVLTEDPIVLAKEQRLTEIPGIGDGIAARIEEFVLTGQIKVLEDFKALMGPAAAEVAALTGLSADKLRKLHAAIGLTSVEALLQAAREHRVREIPGFGARREEQIIEKLCATEAPPEPLHRHQVEAVISTLGLRPTGEWRRGEELPSRVEVVATEKPPLPMALAVTDTGKTLEARLPDDVSLRVHITDSPGVTQLLTTGDETYVARIEAHAKKRGINLNALKLDNETQVYEALGLQWVAPELRRADAPDSPERLLEEGDVIGAVHCHSTYSDGGDSIEDMVRAAGRLGMRYITITDHSPAAHYAGGVPVDRLQEQWDEIDRVQETTHVKIFKGCEADILQDGAIDYPDRILERFDVIIASVHQRHKLGREEMTARVIKAVRHPLFKIWGHPFGRLVPSRPPIDIDIDAVLEAVAQSRCAIELNGDPYRLDLPPKHIPSAKARGIRFVISADAHSTKGLKAFRNAVTMARRGGLSKEDVLNTHDAASFAEIVRPKRPRNNLTRQQTSLTP